MRELSNKGEAGGGRPLQQVLLHPFYGLQIVLPEPLTRTQDEVKPAQERQNKKTQSYFKEQR